MQFSLFQIFSISCILIIIIFIFKNRQRINVIINDPNIKFKDNFVKNTKEGLGWYYKRVIIDFSPLSFTVIGISVFYWFLYEYGDKSSQLMFWIDLTICLPICYILMRKLMTFTLLFVIDLKTTPYKIACWRLSHKVFSRYTIKDIKGENSQMVSPFKCKKGEGFIINDMDNKKLVIQVNTLHKTNNVDLVADIVEAFKAAVNKAVELQHTVNDMRATMPIKVLAEASKMVEHMSITEQLIQDAIKKDILDAPNNEKDMKNLLDNITQKSKLEG